MNKFIVILLILFVATQCLSVATPVHASHEVDEHLHQLLHEIGQPHSHGKDNDQNIEISYSEEALEHSNSAQDSNTVFVFEFTLSNFPEIILGSAAQWPQRAWDPPYLYEIPPPPKV